MKWHTSSIWKMAIGAGLSSVLALSLASGAALMINFSSAPENDIHDWGLVGADDGINVRITGRGNDLIDVGIQIGEVAYRDYRQEKYLPVLGQPYATVVIGPLRSEEGELGSEVKLDLSLMMLQYGVSTYQMTLYYAGDNGREGFESLSRMASTVVDRQSGERVQDQVKEASGFEDPFWSAHSLVPMDLDFQNFSIYTPLLGEPGNESGTWGGLAAIKFEFVPEPGAPLLLGLGLLALAKRRRRG